MPLNNSKFEIWEYFRLGLLKYQTSHIPEMIKCPQYLELPDEYINNQVNEYLRMNIHSQIDNFVIEFIIERL